jgi:hypothetical protein
MWNDFNAIRAIKDACPTPGEETIGINPLCLYPCDISVKDIRSIVQSKLTVEQIVTKYPVPGNFLADKGYLTYKAWQQYHATKNPLAVRAVFDTLNTNSEICNPQVAQEKIDAYKNDPKLVASALFGAKLRGWASIFTLLFLLALADYEAFVEHARTGWFPSWPGLDDLPQSLLSSETGLFAIPKYFVSDVSTLQ